MKSFPERICLCGVMGAGKTSVGKELADRLSYIFVDLDGAITNQQDRTISEIFEQDGEEYFRKLELEAGGRALMLERVVISLGGGALTQASLSGAVKKSAYLVYLEAAPETLFARIAADTSRPLLDGARSLEEFQAVYDKRISERKKGYTKADLTIKTDESGIEEIVEQVLKSIPGNPARV